MKLYTNTKTFKEVAETIQHCLDSGEYWPADEAVTEFPANFGIVAVGQQVDTNHARRALVRIADENGTDLPAEIPKNPTDLISFCNKLAGPIRDLIDTIETT